MFILIRANASRVWIRRPEIGVGLPQERTDDDAIARGFRWERLAKLRMLWRLRRVEMERSGTLARSMLRRQDEGAHREVGVEVRSA